MQTSTRENWLIAGIVIVILLLIYVWMGGGKGKGNTNTATTTTATSTEESATTTGSDLPSGSEAELIPGDNAGTVVVNDQPAGSSVAIERVNFEKAGWVVIREDNNGTAGKVLGARCFNPGTNQGNMTVLITDGKNSKSLTPGSSYIAQLRDDNDGECVYNGIAEEASILDEAGKPVQAIFQALAGTASTTAN
jgi:hypothetical protein